MRRQAHRGVTEAVFMGQATWQRLHRTCASITMFHRKLLKSSLVRMPAPKKTARGKMATMPWSPTTPLSAVLPHHRPTVARLTTTTVTCKHHRRLTHTHNGGSVKRDAFLVWLKREISVALMKGNARMFEQFVCAVPEQNGQRYLEGFAVPTVPE